MTSRDTGDTVDPFNLLFVWHVNVASIKPSQSSTSSTDHTPEFSGVDAAYADSINYFKLDELNTLWALVVWNFSF